MASLRDLQREFASALRDPAGGCAVQPHANLDIYRHNTLIQFGRALEISYPVLRQRVGPDYFRQLVHHYRLKHPSRSGDLHWAGREFAPFLAGHLAGGDYLWLADLARLEWLRELATVAEVKPPVGADVMGKFAQSELEHLVFELQPSLGLLESPFPVFSVWWANQQVDASPVDQSRGNEQGMVLSRDDQIRVLPLTSDLFSYLSALQAGSPLGEAMARGGLNDAGLLRGLQLLFEEQMVCSVRVALYRSKR
jgi:hypothetical protein